MEESFQEIVQQALKRIAVQQDNLTHQLIKQRNSLHDFSGYVSTPYVKDISGSDPWFSSCKADIFS